MKIPIGTVTLKDKFVMMNLSNGLLEVSDDTALNCNGNCNFNGTFKLVNNGNDNWKEKFK